MFLFKIIRYFNYFAIQERIWLEHVKISYNQKFVFLSTKREYVKVNMKNDAKKKP